MEGKRKNNQHYYFVAHYSEIQISEHLKAAADF